MEDLSKSQIDLQKGDLVPIPTIEEHEREIRKIFLVCGVTGVLILISSVTGILLALYGGIPLSTLALIVPIVMGIALVTFGVGYAIPAGLVGLKRLGLTIRMGYESLEMAHNTTKAAQEIKKDAAGIVRDLKDLMTKARPVVEVANQQVQDGYLERIESHLKGIADRVKRDTAPLPIKQRQTEG